LAEAGDSPLIPDATYGEQEAMRLRVAARVRSTLVYRLGNLLLLPLAVAFAWPAMSAPSIAIALLIAGFLINGGHILLHFFDHPWAERWRPGALIDAALYGLLAAASGGTQSPFVLFFLLLILTSSLRFNRRDAWLAGGLAMIALVLLQLFASAEATSVRLGVLALIVIAAAAAAGEIGKLVTMSRDRMLEAVLALLDSNRRLLAEQQAHHERTRQVYLLMESTEEAIFGIDRDGNCTFVNPACLRMLGYSDERELLGRNMHATVHHSWPDGRPYPHEQCRVRQSVLDGETVHSDQEVHWRADGSSFPVEYWARPILVDGRIEGAVVSFIDISDRVAANAQMRKLSLALEQTADAVTIKNRDGVIEYVNPAFEEVTGYSPAEALGRTDEFLRSGQHDDAFYQRIRDRVLAGEVYRDVFIHRRKNGHLFYEEKTITPLKNAQGEVEYVVSTGKDITDRMENEQRLHHLANHDLLTGLPNRALLLERLQHALSLPREQKPLGILLLDLDRFKVINDTLGHQAGDSLLKQLGERLQEHLGKGDTLARLGGDEFAVLVEQAEGSEELAAMAQGLLKTLERPLPLNERHYFLGASIGISVAPFDTLDPLTMLRYADIAMYRAKELGRNRYQFYSDELGRQVVHRMHLESRLREAVERGEFRLFYQPQISVAHGHVVGFEALLRWDNPEHEVVGPDQFVPILEETGLILPLGEWILESACQQIMQWDLLTPDLRIAINVSGRQFTDPGFIPLVDRALSSSGLPAGRLEIEITESTIMRDDGATIGIFDALTQRGIRIAIDDFGTGYSSLSYLKRFPLDILKIDRSFINDLPSDDDDASIVRTIIAMARTLNLEVIAEGVETDAQFGFLAELGCDIVQGYHFSSPLPPEPARRLLQQRQTWNAEPGLPAANDSFAGDVRSSSILRPLPLQLRR